MTDPDENYIVSEWSTPSWRFDEGEVRDERARREAGRRRAQVAVAVMSALACGAFPMRGK